MVYEMRDDYGMRKQTPHVGRQHFISASCRSTNCTAPKLNDVCLPARVGGVSTSTICCGN